MRAICKNKEARQATLAGWRRERELHRTQTPALSGTLGSMFPCVCRGVSYRHHYIKLVLSGSLRGLFDHFYVEGVFVRNRAVFDLTRVRCSHQLD